MDEETALKVSRLKILCDEIIDKKDYADAIFVVEKDMLQHQKPNVWSIWSEGNLERVLEVEFQKFAVAVQEHISIDIEKISTFAFYATVEYLKEKHKPTNQ